MQPMPAHIRDIALWDPVAAYGILAHIPRIPWYASCKASFLSFVVGGPPIVSPLDTTVTSRVWMQDMRYSVSQPNVFAGTSQKSHYDAALRQAPGVSARIEVYSGPRYLPAINYAPLENLADIIISVFPTGWPLFKQQSIQTEFVLTQAPPSVSPNAPPYDVTLTFRGWQFLDHTLDEMSGADAAALLKQAGFETAAIPVLRRT
jgi:hypothetical protein